MAEFALIMPVLFLVVGGVVEFGRLLATLNGLSNASREGARYGSVVGDANAGSGGTQPYYLDCAGMRLKAKSSSFLVPLTDGNIAVEYDHGAGTVFATCAQDTQPSPAIVNGDRVVVRTIATYRPVMPLVPIPVMVFTFTAARSIFPYVVGAPQCSDLLDNDGDGQVDFPNDTDCDSSADGSESPPPGTCFTLTTAVEPAGSATIVRAPMTDINCTGADSGKYTSATNVVLTLNPSTGYAFVGWTGNASGTVNPVTIPMTNNKSATAHLTADCYTLTVTADHGTVTPTVVSAPNGACTGGYTYGTQLSLQATGDSGYSFTGWSGALSGSGNPASLTMDANKAVTASFVTVACYDFTSTANPPAGGTVTIDTAANCGAQYNSGTTVHVSAAPAEGYALANWTQGGTPIGTSSPLNYVVTSSSAVEGNFTPIVCNAVNTSVSPAGAGVVTTQLLSTPFATYSCPSGTYPAQSQVRVTATANPGYNFSAWSGSSTSTNSVITVVISSAPSDPTNLTANFVAPCYTLSLTKVPTSAPNTLSASPASSTGCAAGQYHFGEAVTLTASGPVSQTEYGISNTYTFYSWSGALSSTSNPAVLTMPAANSSVVGRIRARCVNASPKAAGADTIQVDYINYTGDTRYISQVELTWNPGSQSVKLSTVQFGTTVIWSGNASPTAWLYTWAPGANVSLLDLATKTETFTFSKTAAGAYIVKTTFDGDATCKMTITGNFP
jgi:uncharacterized repeat protein (TIGR02543 family)